MEEYLPLIRRNGLSVLRECLVTEIIVDNEKCFFTCLYRSPNQNHEELENFSFNLDLPLSNINNNHPTCSILIGDFNAKSSKWCNSDKSNRTGIELDNITNAAGYSQLINEPTHFINKTFSRIDLIFCEYYNCKYPEWMNSFIISSLKKRTKYTKTFYEIPQIIIKIY